jgi:hypothetical protein
MGVGGSVDKGSDPNYNAFISLMSEYEGDYKAKLADGSITEEQVLQEFKARFISMVNDPALKVQLQQQIENDPNSKNVLKSLLNDQDTLDMRGLHVGDIVKVKDDGFYVEGVVIIIEGDQCLVDFGVEELHDSPEDQEQTASGDDIARKHFNIKDCILVMSGEEFEVGDKVEVKLEGTFLFAVGNIYKTHRKFNPETSSVEVTYDVHMEGTTGEAIAMRPHSTMEERIAHYEEILHTKNLEELDHLDMEYAVKPDSIRKILSGRIQAADRWKSAWRKVTAMMAFRHAGLVRSPNSEESSGEVRDIQTPSAEQTVDPELTSST